MVCVYCFYFMLYGKSVSLESGKAVLFGPLFYFYFLALLLRNMGEKQRFEEAIWICLQMESG